MATQENWLEIGHPGSIEMGDKPTLIDEIYGYLGLCLETMLCSLEQEAGIIRFPLDVLRPRAVPARCLEMSLSRNSLIV